MAYATLPLSVALGTAPTPVDVGAAVGGDTVLAAPPFRAAPAPLERPVTVVPRSEADVPRLYPRSEAEQTVARTLLALAPAALPAAPAYAETDEDAPPPGQDVATAWRTAVAYVASPPVHGGGDLPVVGRACQTLLAAARDADAETAAAYRSLVAQCTDRRAFGL